VPSIGPLLLGIDKELKVTQKWKYGQDWLIGVGAAYFILMMGACIIVGPNGPFTNTVSDVVFSAWFGPYVGTAIWHGSKLAWRYRPRREWQALTEDAREAHRSGKI